MSDATRWQQGSNTSGFGNPFQVGRRSDGRIVVLTPLGDFTAGGYTAHTLDPSQALNLAACLVTLVDDREKFDSILEAMT